MTQASDDSATLVRAAADGNDAALQGLLDLLASDSGQRPALVTLLGSSDGRIWSRLVVFSARDAAAASEPQASDQSRRDARRARNAVTVAFTARRDASSDAAREQALKDALTSPDEDVRAFAAELLGRRDSPDVAAMLAQVTNDPSDRVRVAAVRALGGQRSEQAIPLLLRALERFDIVSGEAVNSLIRIGRPAVPQLVGELQNGSSWTRWHAARALGGIGDPLAIAPLIDALTDDDSGVRWESVHALSSYGPQVLAPLLRALTVHNVTPWFAEGAGRVISRVATGDLAQPFANLQRMLHHLDAAVEVPIEAARLRQTLPPQA